MTTIKFIFKCENPFCAKDAGIKDIRFTSKNHKSRKKLLAKVKKIAKRVGGVFVKINNETHFFCCKDCKRDFVNLL